jgi:hypothetical protein
MPAGKSNMFSNNTGRATQTAVMLAYIASDPIITGK